MPLFAITRISRAHRKVLGYVPFDDGVRALHVWGARGLVPGDWLEAERVHGSADSAPQDITRTDLTVAPVMSS